MAHDIEKVRSIIDIVESEPFWISMPHDTTINNKGDKTAITTNTMKTKETQEVVK